jgi:hypothetical protein
MIHATTTPFDVLQWVFAVALVIVWFMAMSDRND